MALLVIFFCFKQKTAYEMRISDWSSDVCSSDLRARELAATIASRAPIAAETAKLNLRAAVSMPLDKAMEYERDLQAICFPNDDAQEVRAAFTQKRTPQFHRRGKPREGQITMWRTIAAVAGVALRPARKQSAQGKG